MIPFEPSPIPHRWYLYVMTAIWLLLCHDSYYISFHLNFSLHFRVMYAQHYSISLDLHAGIVSGANVIVYAFNSFSPFHPLNESFLFVFSFVRFTRLPTIISPSTYLKNYNNCLFMRNHSIQ